MSVLERIAARTFVGVEHVAGLGPCWEYDGAHDRDGYAVITLYPPHRKARVHRVVFGEEHDGVTPGMVVDHRCHNPGCIRGAHLRELTNAQNGQNRAGAPENSSTGVRNVYRRGSRFSVRATANGVRHFGGHFTTIEEAERAAIALREQIGMTT